MLKDGFIRFGKSRVIRMLKAIIDFIRFGTGVLLSNKDAERIDGPRHFLTYQVYHRNAVVVFN